MSTHDKYESRIRKAAQLDSLENGLRDGGKCLICQCWRKPCANCSAVARKVAERNGKSMEYQRAAARLGSIIGPS